MKSKTRKMRNSVFPLHDAVAIPCSEQGFSLLQWDFNKRSGFYRHSNQLPTDVVKQILSWRDSHKLRLDLIRSLK